MKKVHILSIVLCAALLLQCIALTGCAINTPAQGELNLETVPAEPAAPFKPETAKSVLLYDVDKNADIMAYEPDSWVAPGSLAKLVTAFLVLEECDPAEQVTSDRYDLDLPAGSRNMNLHRLEVLTAKDLAAGMLLEGANDAALALVDHVSDSREAFVEKMNRWAEKIGCTDTKFADVLGLDMENAYTTAHDLVKIMKAVQENETVKELIRTATYEIPATDRSEVRELITNNYMIDQHLIPEFYDQRVTGGMASTNQDATGQWCHTNLISTVEDGGSYIAIVLGAERTFQENGWSPKHWGNYEEMTALLSQGLTK